MILTGIIGALFANEVLLRLRFRDESVRGFAIGLAAHGIGTARALQISTEAGGVCWLGNGLKRRSDGNSCAVAAASVGAIAGAIHLAIKPV